MRSLKILSSFVSWITADYQISKFHQVQYFWKSITSDVIFSNIAFKFIFCIIWFIIVQDVPCSISISDVQFYWNQCVPMKEI